MQQEQQFQIGDRVVVNSGLDKEFYGIIEKFSVGGFPFVRLYDGRCVSAYNDWRYLQKVDPYDIRYVMPGDILRSKERDDYSKVLDVRSYVVGISTFDKHEACWGFSTREELAIHYKISEPIGNEEQQQEEDEWEEVKFEKLAEGDVVKEDATSVEVDILSEPIKADTGWVAYEGVREGSSASHINTKHRDELVYRKKRKE